MSTYAFDGAKRLVCSYVEDGVHRLGVIDLASLAAAPVALPYQDISSVPAAAGRVARIITGSAGWSTRRQPCKDLLAFNHAEGTPGAAVAPGSWGSQVGRLLFSPHARL